MTWVVGGNCFNGFICVADIQATIEFNNGRPNEYFNCVQKIHKVFDNLCVAFSGDIRSGLLIIEDLSREVPLSIKEGEYFDIDGQSSMLISYLHKLYKKINPITNPYLELMFLWMAQEGDELEYRPFCMKFKAPDFRLNSTPQLGVAQSGSGVNNQSFKSIVSFLSGRHNDSEDYRKIFSNIENAPRISTVHMFKKLIFQEASAVELLGVSKSLISFESVINHKDIYPDEMHSMLKDTFIDIGIEYTKESTENCDVDLVIFDAAKIDKIIKDIEKYDSDKYERIRRVLSLAKELEDFDCIRILPPITSDQHIASDEEIHSQRLIVKWTDMVSFLKKKKINVKACHAMA